MTMDYEADLPNLDHWKSVMEFTVEQAALLLAMIDPFDVETLAEAKDQRLPRWKMARAHCLAITSAIRMRPAITPCVIKVAATYAVAIDRCHSPAASAGA